MNASNEKKMDETAGETGNVSGILEATSLKIEVVGLRVRREQYLSVRCHKERK